MPHARSDTETYTYWTAFRDEGEGLVLKYRDEDETGETSWEYYTEDVDDWEDEYGEDIEEITYDLLDELAEVRDIPALAKALSRFASDPDKGAPVTSLPLTVEDVKEIWTKYEDSDSILEDHGVIKFGNIDGTTALAYDAGSKIWTIGDIGLDSPFSRKLLPIKLYEIARDNELYGVMSWYEEGADR